jgi:hypothetical protein
MEQANDNMEQASNKNDKKKKKPKFKEPKIKWLKCKARELLYKDIYEGRVPSVAKDANKQSTMPLRDIYLMHSEYADYDYEKFSGRLSSLRKIVNENNRRAEADQAAFDQYKNNHQASLFSHKGYIQWQGSDAQNSLLQDLEEGVHLVKTKRQLWLSRSEYHDEFPLGAFRDYIYQELRTHKYLRTLHVKGKTHKAS